jgi:hypothetical protein
MNKKYNAILNNGKVFNAKSLASKRGSASSTLTVVERNVKPTEAIENENFTLKLINTHRPSMMPQIVVEQLGTAPAQFTSNKESRLSLDKE